MDEAEQAAFNAKRRKRNLAIAAALVGWVILIYIISIVRMHEGIEKGNELRGDGGGSALESTQ